MKAVCERSCHESAFDHDPRPRDDEAADAAGLIDTGGAMPGSLELRCTRKNGKDTVTDGPFAESKEVVGGFALMEVADREEALELTRRFLDLVGDATCELHEVSTA